MNPEFQLIERLCKRLPEVSRDVCLGPGDDAAVLMPSKNKQLVTVDALVEGIHFDFKFCEPEEVGKKSLAVNCSDLVAMGGKPKHALISLGVSKTVSETILERIYIGLSQYASRYSINVVGGNVVSSPERLNLSVTLLGECIEKPLLRSGAHQGDLVFISGTPGEAAAGLALLKKEGREIMKAYPSLTQQYLTPEARLDLLEILAVGNRVNSLIDVSDGLSSELGHLSKASHVGFVIHEEKLPVSAELKRAGQALGKSLREWQLSGGEDYELLGTCSPTAWNLLEDQAKKRGIDLFLIGEVVSFEEGISLKEISGKKLPFNSSGWDHLRGSERD